ncbi:hypothetical protein R5R35_006711 [Gryllus longicercus]|uniref:Sodium/potassium/calcium exchanger 5 n=1 Tax=Gryllus longicercus TaxID=2509291 RepID=A0AAN9VWF2_9ORTH
MSLLPDHGGGEPPNCTPPAIDDFPHDLLSEQQRRDGAVVLHVLVSLYLFVALAVVCDRYFVPAVERICQALNMSNDVAGATFMAAATSAPELFVNVIGTFITEGDIGVGTIVGSAVFNILAVAACCGIGAGIVVPLDWWPLTRDCLAYGVTVALMICIIHDERVEWYEALTLVLLYIVYIAVMYWDKSIQRCARGRICMCDRAQEEDAADQEIPAEAGEIRLPLQTDGALAAGAQAQPAQQVQQEQPAQQQQQLQDSQAQQAQQAQQAEKQQQQQQQDSQEQPQQAQQAQQAQQVQQAQLALQAQTPPQQQNGTVKVPIEPNGSDADSASVLAWASLVHWPSERRVWHKALWVAVWPIHLVFLVTIPDCEKPRFKRWFPLTFVMCILWIGSLSYVVAWMITIIGDTLRIPDSVMGITFLAAGTSVPEAVSSVIVAKQGHGSMGISNSIGSNTFDILLCLGLPWLIKASFLPTTAGQHFVGINSRGLEYSAISLLSTLFLLYATFSLNKFKLNRKVGQACLLMYGMFLVLASLIELNVFFMVNLPTCGR